MSNRIAAIGFSLLCWVASAAAQPAISSIVNAASFETGIPRGCLVTIFGSNLGVATERAKALPLPTNLVGTVVTVGDLELEAPLYFVSPTQINFQLPFEALGGVLPVVVTTPAGKSKPMLVTVTASGPGIFTLSGDGKGKALAFGPDLRPLDAATPGSTMVLYATGLGPTDPPSLSGSSGAAVEPFNRVLNVPEVIVGEFPARVDFAGMAPGLPGVYQLNVVPQQIGTDRLFIRSQGRMSNMTSIGVRATGQNVANASGTIDAIYPTANSFPGGFSLQLLAVKFTAKMDILPSAGPFMVAAVSDAGTSLVSVDPTSGTFDATVTVPTQLSRVGDFSVVAPEFRILDLLTCHIENGATACVPFPGNILPASRIPPDLLKALDQVPLPNTPSTNSPTATFKVSGTAGRGSTFIIDDQNNSAVSTFAGYLVVPLPASFTPGPPPVTTTVKLFIDGQVVASKDITFSVFPNFGGGPQ